MGGGWERDTVQELRSSAMTTDCRSKGIGLRLLLLAAYSLLL